MKKITLILFLLISMASFSQDIFMSNGSFSQCGDTFYDSGGATSSYGNNENYVLTICPPNVGDAVRIDFTAFSTQLDRDILTIYNGPDISSPSLGSFSGGSSNSPGVVQATAANPSGCLTFQWISDGTGSTTGWAANISCSTPCQNIVANIDSTVPAFDVTNVIVADVSEIVTYNASATFSISGAGATFDWDFGDGTTGTGETTTHAYATSGVYTVTLIVRDANPAGCTSNTLRLSVQVGASSPGNPYVDAGDDITITCVETCTDISASFLEIGETNTYTITSIPFVPPFPFQGLTNPLNPNIDDAWSNVENLPFDFCFFNNIETQFQIGSNGVIRFDVNPSDTGPLSNDWQLFNNNLPNNSNEALAEANIFTPCHDIDPNAGTAEQIGWEIIGAAPNRVLAVSFYNVPLYSMSCNNLLATHMAVFYETTNVIDIYIKNKPTCTSWNGGKAVVGIQNDAGTTAFVPPGRNINNSPWTTSNEAWRFTPTGPSVIDFAWLDAAGNVLGTTPTLNVCPTTPTTYTARVIYTNCNGDVVTVTDDVVVSKDVPFTVDAGPDQNLCIGNPDIVLSGDIGSATATYQWFKNGIELTGDTNATLTVSSPNTGNYSVFVTDASCTLSNDVVITFYPEPIVNSISDYILCEDATVDGFTEFNLSTKDAEAIGSQTDVAVSYHLNQPDADSGANPLPALFTNTETSQTIYVRLENANNALCFVTTTFNLNVSSGIVLAQPANMNVCDDDSDGIATFNLASQTPIMLNGLTGITISYHFSQDDANNNRDALPNNYTNTSTPQTIYVRAEDDSNPLCFTSLTFDLNVNPLPTVVNPTPLVVCDDNVPDGITSFNLNEKDVEITGGDSSSVVTYYLNSTDANSGNPPLAIPYTNVVNGQTVFVRVQNSTTGCFDVTTLLLQVAQAPIAFVPDALNYCDPNNDGFGEFTLSDVEPQVTGGAPGLSVSYHVTMNDAERNVDSLPIDYENTDAFTQTIYIRVVSTILTTDCATIVPLVLNVLPIPMVPNSIADYVICDTDPDGFVQFDLTTKNAEILGTQNPADYVLTYHLTQNDAEYGLSQIVNSSNYTNVDSPTQIIYVRLEGVNGCYKTGQFLIRVNLPPLVVQPAELSLCDDAVADEMTNFDLTVKDGEIINNDGSLSVRYYPTNADALADNNVIDPANNYTNTSVNGLPANPETLYVRVTDNDTGCTAFTTLIIRVLPNPTLGTDPADIILCDDINTGDGKEVFDLTANENSILNGATGVTPTYYATFDHANEATNAIVDPTNYTNSNSDFTSQTIYVRVTNDLTGCYAIVDFDILVNPLPDVIAVTDYILCEVNTDGFDKFDLNSKTAEVLNGQNASQYSITYHAFQEDADDLMNPLTSPYTNIANPQRIYVAITNNITGCSISTPSFEIEVDNGAEANSNGIPIEQVVCDYLGDNDGLAQFDLTENNPQVLDGQDPTNFVVTYYFAEADAELGVNPIPNIYENISNPQVIFVRVDNNELDVIGMDSSICYAVSSLRLKVNLLPIFDLEDSYTLCVETNGNEVIDPPVLTTGLSATNYTFEWTLNGIIIADQTGPRLIATQSGLYEVKVTNNTTGCFNRDSAEVVESAPPTLTAEVTTLAFSDDSVIKAIASGIGFYEYNLDNGAWQSSGIFENVSSGEHVIMARDKNGCGLTSVTIMVFDYPHFFTPNGDGFNETWNIVGFAGKDNTRIFIFDRFGKLLKQISPSGQGWNGTYNGELMPTNDYWFTVEYAEPSTGESKKFKAHFTLKR